jgi:hypothetical protein
VAEAMTEPLLFFYISIIGVVQYSWHQVILFKGCQAGVNNFNDVVYRFITEQHSAEAEMPAK